MKYRDDMTSEELKQFMDEVNRLDECYAAVATDEACSEIPEDESEDYDQLIRERCDKVYPKLP